MILRIPPEETKAKRKELAAAFECLVCFGDTLPPGVFGAYRLWVSSTNVTRWQARETRSNEPVETTFTYDDYRTVYGASVRYRGNWRTEGFTDCRQAAYMVEFPKTDRVLGDTEVALDFISLNYNNGTLQQEKHAYWMARQVDLASIAMRYVHVSVNGSALFRYDSLSPSRTLCTSFYGDDDPHVYEQLYPHEPFGNYTTTGGVKKQAKYRYCMRKKSTTVPDDVLLRTDRVRARSFHLEHGPSARAGSVVVVVLLSADAR